MLFILSGLLLSLNTLFLYKIVELTQDDVVLKDLNYIKTPYVLLAMGISEVIGAFLSGNVTDNTSDYFQRVYCFVGYFLVLISCLMTVYTKWYILAIITGVLTGFFTSAHNTII